VDLVVLAGVLLAADGREASGGGEELLVDALFELEEVLEALDEVTERLELEVVEVFV
jgi:hypothetical protein